MPIDYRDYPADWREIRERILERATRRLPAPYDDWSAPCCERCGAPHEWVIHRPADDPGRWDFEDDVPEERETLVILTIAHIGAPHADGTPGDKHNKHDVRPENLLALCQRCHLLEDLDDHVRHAAETRRRRRIEAGQTELFSTT